MNSVREDDIKNIIARIPYEQLENKTILITGANGFMASYIVDTLMYLNCHVLVAKCKVIALCRNYEKARNCFEPYLEDKYFKLLIQSVEEKIDLNEKIDYVFHAAGSSASAMHKIAPVDILKSNIVGTYNVLECAKDNQASSMLYFSSGAVYGEVPSGIVEISEEESFTCSVEDYYSEAKRAGESMCMAYWRQYQVPVKSIRIGHTYGPGIDLNDGHVYSDFVKSIYHRKNLIITGDGTAVRAFCYITDAVVSFFLILLLGINGEAYNMCNQRETLSIRELAEKLTLEVFRDRHLRVEGEYLAEYSQRKANLSTKKLESLGWTTTINIVEGFRRTLKSFEEEGVRDGEKKF